MFGMHRKHLLGRGQWRNLHLLTELPFLIGSGTHHRAYLFCFSKGLQSTAGFRSKIRSVLLKLYFLSCPYCFHYIRTGNIHGSNHIHKLNLTNIAFVHLHLHHPKHIFMIHEIVRCENLSHTLKFSAISLEPPKNRTFSFSNYSFSFKLYSITYRLQ